MTKPLASVSVRDFQSIPDAQVELGSFTVLVGPSSSGKSAFLRAVRACVRNTFSPANVRTGAKKSEVTLTFSDGVKVTIERGKSLSSYTLGSESFTKSARSVPPEVEAALSFPLLGGVDSTFSFQFDRPFLLAETGSVVGQVVGSLTNASLLASAVREANRRRQEAVITQRLREGDLVSLGARLETYRDLPQELSRVESLEASLARVEELDGRREAIQRQVQSYRREEQSSSAPPTPPVDLSEALSAVESQVALRSSIIRLLTDLRTEIRAVRTAKEAVEKSQKSVQESESAVADRLRAWGECPTCGQAIPQVEHVH